MNKGDTRGAIAALVRNLPQGTHLTAQEVFERARASGLGISLSTVYRTLQRLKSDGDVNTVFSEKGLRYEKAEAVPDHDHLICLGCSLTIEFSDSLIAGFGKNVAQRKGYAYNFSRFDILGYCAECRSKSPYHRIEEINTIAAICLTKVDQLRNLLLQVKERSESSVLLEAIGTCELADELSHELNDHCRHLLTLLDSSLSRNESP